LVIYLYDVCKLLSLGIVFGSMKRKETRGGRGQVSMKRVLKCVWSGFIWLRTRSIETCEQGNEPSAFVIGGEYKLAEQTSALKDTAVRS